LTTVAFRYLKFESLDSTNAEGCRLAQKGEGGPLWIIAAKQTAGKGRRGRDWVSKPGNLFATFLVTIPVNPATAAQVSFVTALALHDACVSLLPPNADISLKWPNDLLLEGKKVAGILLETVPCAEPEKIVLAIGCGVNVQHAPGQTVHAATWLNAHMATQLSPDRFLGNLAPCLNLRLAQWKNGQGFDLIAKAWQERASHMGKLVSLTSASQTITGKFLALANDGALVLELTDGSQKHFHAGDVSLRSQNDHVES